MESRASPDFTKQNGIDAIALNNKFKDLTATSKCTDGENACVKNQFAQCVGTTFVLTSCGTNEICAVLPLVNKAGTSVTCTTQDDLDARIKATGAQSTTSSNGDATKRNAANGNKGDATKGDAAKGDAAAGNTGKGNGTDTGAAGGGADDAQTSLTLDPAVIAKGFAQNGQAVQEAGQVASLTSTNNFINFCKGKTLTDGKQVTGGSCNPAPMGDIPSSSNMPSCKFQNPKNMDTIKANTAFTISMAIKGMQTGFFVNAEQNYFAAPQQLNAQGQIQGHSHVVVEAVSSLASTDPLDPQKFAFFKGLNAAASGGVLTADVTAGLPAGVYKLSSINTAANHQPALVPIAQHGSLDDAVYFTVTDDGKAAAGGAAGGDAASGNAATNGTVADAAGGDGSVKKGDGKAATGGGAGGDAATNGTVADTAGGKKGGGKKKGGNNKREFFF
jgi:hypothetical protein